MNTLTNAIQTLVSGFVACWIFYAMTAHPKPTTTEQAIQALIFTAFIRVAVAITQSCFLFIGRNPWINFGYWQKDYELGWGLIYGILFGFCLALCANRDIPFCHFRKWGWTKKHTFPSVWYHIFNDSSWSPWAVLHVNPGPDSPRAACRLHGYIYEWPDDPKTGHFVVMKGSWILDDGTTIDLSGVESILISAAEVELVQFLERSPDEVGEQGDSNDGVSKQTDPDEAAGSAEGGAGT